MIKINDTIIAIVPVLETIFIPSYQTPGYILADGTVVLSLRVAGRWETLEECEQEFKTLHSAITEDRLVIYKAVIDRAKKIKQ